MIEIGNACKIVDSLHVHLQHSPHPLIICARLDHVTLLKTLAYVDTGFPFQDPCRTLGEETVTTYASVLATATCTTRSIGLYFVWGNCT